MAQSKNLPPNRAEEISKTPPQLQSEVQKSSILSKKLDALDLEHEHLLKISRGLIPSAAKSTTIHQKIYVHDRLDFSIGLCLFGSGVFIGLALRGML